MDCGYCPTRTASSNKPAHREMGAQCTAVLQQWLMVLQSPCLDVASTSRMHVHVARDWDCTACKAIVPAVTGAHLRDTALANAFLGLDQILHKALRHAVGLWSAVTSWQDACCVLTNVMLRNASVLRCMQTMTRATFINAGRQRRWFLQTARSRYWPRCTCTYSTAPVLLGCGNVSTAATAWLACRP
jgi:hypothetical protein